MTINIHELPKNPTKLQQLKYQVAVMEAAGAGKPVECLDTSNVWHSTGAPSWLWDSYQYRIKPPAPVAKGHNLYNLTEDQVGVKSGWRLLTKEEIDFRISHRESITRTHVISKLDYEYGVIEGWDAGLWKGDTKDFVYRTQEPAGYFLQLSTEEWLNDALPEEYVDLALKYIPAARLKDRFTCAGDALTISFHWCATDEGDTFWSTVYQHIDGGCELPPFPPSKPKIIAWTLDTVPKQFTLLKWPENNNQYGILNYSVTGVSVATCGGIIAQFPYENLLANNASYSIDFGETWALCGTEL